MHTDPTVPAHIKTLMAHILPGPYGIEHNVPVLQQDPSRAFTQGDRSIETDERGAPTTILGEPGLTWKQDLIIG